MKQFIKNTLFKPLNSTTSLNFVLKTISIFIIIIVLTYNIIILLFNDICVKIVTQFTNTYNGYFDCSVENPSRFYDVVVTFEQLQQNMCKKSFVTLCRGRKRYQLFVADIQEVHRANHKKRPPLPPYECPSTDDSSLQIFEKPSES